jgi:sarcosine oxidase subunit gamma
MANTSNAAQSGTGQSAAGQSASYSAASQSEAGRTAFRLAPQITACAFVRALPPASRYVLRGGPQVMTAAGAALGLTITQIACRAATNGSQAALWLGPDEQLLIGPESADLVPTLQPTLRDLPHSLVEVSHRQIALEVSGQHAAFVLNAGCPLELDLGAFPVGMCTRTVLAKAEIVLWRTDENVFHVEVWRSFASYVTEFLAEVAREVALLTPTLESNS